MKVAPRNVAGFLQKPPQDIRAVLFFGPDQGLIRERARSLCKTVGGRDSEITELTGDQIRKDPALLADAAASLSLIGGDPVVSVREATDVLVKTIEGWLAEGGGIHPGVFAAAELSPRSKLRQLFEKNTSAAAIGCYADTGRDLEQLIQAHVTNAGFSIHPHAVEMLRTHLSNDRMVIRQDLDKLLLYVGEPAEQIGVEDVAAIIGDGRSAGFDDAAVFAAAGNREGLAATLARLAEEDASPLAVLRSVQRHFERLLSVKTDVDAGQMAKDAVKKLRPPIFFRQEPAFLSQVNSWSLHNLKKTISMLLTLERDCKRTHALDRVLFERALLRICLAAEKSKRY